METLKTEWKGSKWLIKKLTRARIKISKPHDDEEGIDLIAYKALRNKFFFMPLHLRTSSSTHLSIRKDYRKLPNLKIIFIWYINDPEKTTAYCFSYAELMEIAEQKGWTKHNRWLESGRYDTRRSGKDVLKLIEPFRFNPQTLFDDTPSAASCNNS